MDSSSLHTAPEATTANKHTEHWRELFLARESELQQLLEIWQQVQTGQPKMVTILGESGLGKTRLVQAFYERLFQQLQAQSQEQAQTGDEAPYWPAKLLNESGNLSFHPHSQNLQAAMPWFWWGLRFTAPTSRNRIDQQSPFERTLSDIDVHIEPVLRHREIKSKAKHAGIAASTIAASMIDSSMLIAEFVTLGIYGSLVALKDVLSSSVEIAQMGASDWDELLAERTDDVVNRTIEKLGVFLDKKCSDAPSVPVVLFLDDAQYADPVTLNALWIILKKAQQRQWPLMVIATHWWKEWQEWQQRPEQQEEQQEEQPDTPATYEQSAKQHDKEQQKQWQQAATASEYSHAIHAVAGMQHLRQLQEHLHEQAQLIEQEPKQELKQELKQEQGRETVPEAASSFSTCINLTQLPQQDLLTIAATALPGITAAQTALLATEAGGNPLMLEQMLGLLTAPSQLPDTFVNGDQTQALSEFGEQELLNLQETDLYQLVKKRFKVIAREVKIALVAASAFGTRYVGPVALDLVLQQGLSTFADSSDSDSPDYGSPDDDSPDNNSPEQSVFRILAPWQQAEQQLALIQRLQEHAYEFQQQMYWRIASEFQRQIFSKQHSLLPQQVSQLVDSWLLSPNMQQLSVSARLTLSELALEHLLKSLPEYSLESGADDGSANSLHNNKTVAPVSINTINLQARATAFDELVALLSAAEQPGLIAQWWLRIINTPNIPLAFFQHLDRAHYHLESALSFQAQATAKVLPYLTQLIASHPLQPWLQQALAQAKTEQALGEHSNGEPNRAPVLLPPDGFSAEQIVSFYHWLLVAADIGRQTNSNMENVRQSYQQALLVSKALLIRLNTNTEAQHELLLQQVMRDVSVSLEKLSDFLLSVDGDDEAKGVCRGYYEESLEICRDIVLRFGETPERLRDVSVSLNKLSDFLLKVDGDDEAKGGCRGYYEESLGLRRDIVLRFGETPERLRDIDVSTWRFVMLNFADLQAFVDARESAVEPRQVNTNSKTAEPSSGAVSLLLETETLLQNVLSRFAQQLQKQGESPQNVTDLVVALSTMGDFLVLKQAVQATLGAGSGERVGIEPEQSEVEEPASEPEPKSEPEPEKYYLQALQLAGGFVERFGITPQMQQLGASIVQKLQQRGFSFGEEDE